MKTDNLDELWIEIESQYTSESSNYQRMVCTDLLYRAFIGISGIPSKRFLSVEIPKEEECKFNSFDIPQGFTVTISTPNVRHDGYVSCTLESTASELNDVFTVVVENILYELRKHNNKADYVSVLKERIEKWREFFRNPRKKRLSDSEVVGLMGELSFLNELYMNGISSGVDMWNGPVKAAQDFQCSSVATEIKTSSAQILESVRISSEIQLDTDGLVALYLGVYHITQNDNSGITLPDLIDEISSRMNTHQKSRLKAKLLCLGYSDDEYSYYTKKYIISEPIFYKIDEGFPRLTKNDLPKGVYNTSYTIALTECADFKVEIDNVLQTVKEYEHG